MMPTGTPKPPHASLPVPNRRHHYFSAGVTLAITGLFAAAAALAVVQPGSHHELPEPFESQLRLALPQPFPSASASTQPFVSETQIRAGDTLAAILQRLDIQEAGLQAFLTHDKSARSIYKLYPGRTVQAAHTPDGQLAWLRYYHTPATQQDGQVVAQSLWVRPDPAQGFVATEQTQQVGTQTRLAQGQINSSLFAATDAAGIPDAITLQMAEILGSKVDFVRDLRKGDRFRVVYETHTHQGKQVGAGRVLALEFDNDGDTYSAFWFEPPSGSGGYYDASGHSLKGAFLRNALKFSRISSVFGMRKHPVHGHWAGHKGVDYAAPSGTPIHATADGTVAFIGWQNGYGNTIVLQHHGKYSTLYGHQRAFARGLKQGSRVEQGQLIGYVGATGWATGPHLHYEFRIDKRPVDPLSVTLPVARQLEGPERKAFQTVAAGYSQHLQMLAALQDTQPMLASR